MKIELVKANTRVVKYYKIYKAIEGSATDCGVVSQLVTIVENRDVAKAICKKEIGYSYIEETEILTEEE